MSDSTKLKLTHAWGAINPTFNVVAILVLLGVLNSSDPIERRITIAGFVLLLNLVATVVKAIVIRPDGTTSVNKAYAFGMVRAFNALAEIIALVVIFLPVGLTVAAVAVVVGVVLIVDLAIEVVEFFVMK